MKILVLSDSHSTLSFMRREHFLELCDNVLVDFASDNCLVSFNLSHFVPFFLSH